MKKTALVTFTLAIALSFSTTASVQATIQEAPITKGQTVSVINANRDPILSGAIMYEGSSYIPASQLHKVMNVEVSWESSSHSVYIKGDQHSVTWYSISDKLKVNGKDVTLTEKPIIQDKRTYVPISLLKKVFHLQVSWDQPSKTVIILDGNPSDES